MGEPGERYDAAAQRRTTARGNVVFGMVRPCRHRLGEKLTAQWMAHLCGLCLALRGDHGQLARIVTNYDGLLISVLTEAQSGSPEGGRRTAGPCPLRGMRTASVAHGEGARLAAAVSLVLASAKMRDHVTDGDGLLARRPVALAARRVAAGWDRAGARTGSDVGFDTAVLLDAVDRQAGIETLAGPGTPILTVTEPTETATAAAFAHTAVLAGRPHNAVPLAEAGRLFGRLAHLLDAVEDREADAASGAWNPLAATGTPLEEARRLADDAVHGIRLALREVDWGSGVPGGHGTGEVLAHRLLVHELPNSVHRAFGTVSCAHGSGAYAPPGAPGGPGGPPPGPPRRDRRGLVTGCAVWLGLACTCQMCCGTYEDPWTREPRQGPCAHCDCSGCGDCCECCNCCSCCGEDGGCDCGCDC